MIVASKQSPKRRRKLAVTLDQRTVAAVDRLIADGRFANRSRAIQNAVDLLIERVKRDRLIRERAKLDPHDEQALAEQNFGDAPWPEFRI